MKEARGNLWEYDAEVRCITTNGTVKRNGEAVMGRGCAKEAADRWPELPAVLGELLQEGGNHVHPLGYHLDGEKMAWEVFSVPVKHHWREKADLNLIKRSAEELRRMMDEPLIENVVAVLPRPGCGNGQLDWDDVKPVIEPILDDRFTVITFA